MPSQPVFCFVVFWCLLPQRDPILAKQLFSALFSSVVREMDKAKPRDESARIKEELRVNMTTFLSKSTLCFPPFIACVQVGPVYSGSAGVHVLVLDTGRETLESVKINTFRVQVKTRLIPKRVMMVLLQW